MIAYGATCSWWDDKEKVGVRPGINGGMPCCPRCKGVLFEIDEETWNKGLQEYSKKDPEYPAFIEWLRGRCYPNVDVAMMDYERGVM